MRKKNIAFIGRSTIDHTYLLGSFPVENQKCFAQNYLMQYGGPALNAAITCCLLGGEAAIISCFGDGIKGLNAKAEITNLYGLKVIDAMVDSKFLIPTSAIIVNGKEASRTIINSPKTEKEALPDYSLIDLSGFSYILLDGYNITGELSDKLKAAKQTGSVIILDGGSWKPELDLVIDLVDYAVCSQVFRLPACSKEQTIEVLQQKGIAFIAFTNDDKPTEIIHHNQSFFVDIEKIEAVDTLGAGDVLHGAFCYYLAEGLNGVEAIKKASAIATASCRFFGTHSWSKFQSL